MKRTEIENFIKKCTPTFQKQLHDWQKQTVPSPNLGFASTAAINRQNRLNFDQDQVLQDQVQHLTNYIVEVKLVNFLKHDLKV